MKTITYPGDVADGGERRDRVDEREDGCDHDRAPLPARTPGPALTPSPQPRESDEHGRVQNDPSRFPREPVEGHGSPKVERDRERVREQLPDPSRVPEACRPDARYPATTSRGEGSRRGRAGCRSRRRTPTTGARRTQVAPPDEQPDEHRRNDGHELERLPQPDAGEHAEHECPAGGRRARSAAGPGAARASRREVPEA